MDYVDIDVTLETENIDSDISQIITSEQIEQEEEIDKEESNQEETRITSADAGMYINKIKQYFLNFEDITAFESVANL